MKKGLYLITILSLLTCVLFVACASGRQSGSIVIASKQFTENILLSEMYAQLIEHYTDLKVVRKQNLGATAVCYSALVDGEVDLYVEYTGTILSELLPDMPVMDMDADAAYALIKTKLNNTADITVFQPIGLNNTYALAMLQDKAEAMGIRSISDMSRQAPALIFAANSLFYIRANDGYDTMTGHYDLAFHSVVKMSSALLYEAAAKGQVDVIVVYATDAYLNKYDMVILEDDKVMFPEYLALPIVRNAALDAYPVLYEVLDLLANQIDNERMRTLNYLVEVENESMEDVARAFLAEIGLLA